MARSIYSELSARFPGLVIASIAPDLTLRGQFELVQDGVLIDSYSVEIRASKFPASEPKVFELDGRVQAGQHKNPDNSCCTGVFEVWRAENPAADLIDFLEGPVRHYFLGHREFLAGRGWPFGERAHGASGVIEAAAEFLGVRADKGTVARYLRAIARKNYDGSQPCPCGSNRPIRLCHISDLVALRRRITSEHALNILRKLRSQTSTTESEGRWRRPELVSRLMRRYLR